MRRHLIYYALQAILMVTRFLDDFVMKVAKTHLVDEEPEEVDGFIPVNSDAWDKPADGDSATISVREIDLGDLRMVCPVCNHSSNHIAVGISLCQDEEEVDGFVADIDTKGVVIYECGTLYFSPCLTDKVATILNAAETDELSPQMFASLSHCEVHGKDYAAE